MRHRRQLLRLTAAAVLVFPWLAVAAPAPPTAADAETIDKIESYLNQVRTVRARFIQVAPNGGIAEGSLYLARPGRMRVEYDPPVNSILVANDVWLIVYDGELEQTSYLPVDASPAAFIMRERISFGDDVEVLDIERQAGLVRIHVSPREQETAGSLYLTFTEAPFALRQWTVIDAQGLATEVALLDPEFDVELDDDLFKFSAPTADPTYNR